MTLAPFMSWHPKELSSLIQKYQAVSRTEWGGTGYEKMVSSSNPSAKDEETGRVPYEYGIQWPIQVSKGHIRHPGQKVAFPGEGPGVATTPWQLGLIIEGEVCVLLVSKVQCSWCPLVTFIPCFSNNAIWRQPWKANFLLINPVLKCVSTSAARPSWPPLMEIAFPQADFFSS